MSLTPQTKITDTPNPIKALVKIKTHTVSVIPNHTLAKPAMAKNAGIVFLGPRVSAKRPEGSCINPKVKKNTDDIHPKVTAERLRSLVRSTAMMFGVTL
jgi:hypothetical protein